MNPPSLPVQLMVGADAFSALMRLLVGIGASDVLVQTDRPILCRVDGVTHIVTGRYLPGAEVDAILADTYGSAAGPTLVRSREILDYAWETPGDDGGRLRFRANATGVRSTRGSDGVEITFRVLPTTTPTWEQVGLSETILSAISSQNGLVIIAGATGQGKSTTLAAILARLLDPAGEGGGRRVVDIQSPIEYTYADIIARASGVSLAQSEVGHHVRDFATGVWSALRRTPDVICIGETRDSATLHASLTAALTGHLVCTTLHAGSVPEIVRRLAALVSGSAGSVGVADLALVTRCLMVQYLVPGADGGRVALREYVEITRSLMLQMQDTPPEEWARLLRSHLQSPDPDIPSCSFAADARRLVEAELVRPDVVAAWLTRM